MAMRKAMGGFIIVLISRFTAAPRGSRRVLHPAPPVLHANLKICIYFALHRESGLDALFFGVSVHTGTITCYGCHMAAQWHVMNDAG